LKLPSFMMSQKEIRDIEKDMPKYNFASGSVGMTEKMTVIQRIMQWVINHLNAYGLSGVQSVLADDMKAFTLIAAKMFEAADNADSATKMNSMLYSDWFQNDQVDIMENLVDDINHIISMYSLNTPYMKSRTTRRESIMIMCNQALLGDYW